MNVYTITLRNIYGQLIKRGLVAKDEKEARKKVKGYRKREKCTKAWIIKAIKEELQDI